MRVRIVLEVDISSDSLENIIQPDYTLLLSEIFKWQLHTFVMKWKTLLLEPRGQYVVNVMRFKFKHGNGKILQINLVFHAPTFSFTNMFYKLMNSFTK